MIKKYIGNNRPEFDTWLNSGNKFDFYLQPLTQIHLHSDFEADYSKNSNITTIYILAFVAILILIISTVNFINLSNIRILQFNKKTGLLKVLGAKTNHLIFQNTLLSISLCFFSFVISVLIVSGISGFMNSFFKNQEINVLTTPIHLAILSFLIFSIGVISGFIPGIKFFTLRTHLTEELSKSGHYKGRNFLITVQNVISITLIIASVFIYKQSSLLEQKQLGFNPTNLIVLKNAHLVDNDLEVFKATLLKYPGIESVSVTDYIPSTEVANYHTFTFNKGNEKFAFSLSGFSADENYLKTLGINVTEGTGLERSVENSCMLNKSAVTQYNIDDPVGKIITYNRKEYRISGIIPDFNYESLRYKIRPLIIKKLDNEGNELFLCVKCNKNKLDETVKFIGKCWVQFAGDAPLNLIFSTNS
ncbi:MAG: FtsX-like permease family protein [Bacteroidales bacterium]|nr:FtsX-like permease family protein [Bacteroidales bacterium]